MIRTLQPGDVLVVTRLDRLARSTRDLLNVLATVSKREAGFRSLKDTWADTTTPHGSSSQLADYSPCVVLLVRGQSTFILEVVRARLE